jgi:aminopeptidase N
VSTSDRPADVDPYVPGHGDAGYSARQYDLRLTYRPSTNRLDARAVIEATARQELDRFTLDLVGLSVSKVLVDGRPPRKYTHRDNKLIVDLARPIADSQTFSVSVAYAGHPEPVRSRWGEVGWEELREGSLVAGQPTGAPSWFPCNDHPANKARYRIAVTTDSPFAVVANGTLIEQRSRASTTTWVYESPQPMASYLATVQIGHYVSRRSDELSPTIRVTAPARLSAHAAADFSAQRGMMTLFEELFGPYPFDDYSVVVTDDALEIPIEAQGLSIFGSNHVNGRGAYERLVAHELAHQWFGNSLTVLRWRDIWLHEGFACYAEWLWSERSGGPSAQSCAERYWKRLKAAPEDLLLADPGPDLMFDDRLYKRGALTLHVVRQSLGDSGFFDLLRDWVVQHEHGSVTTEQFVEHVKAADAATAELVAPWLFSRPMPRLPAPVARRRT